MIPFTSWLADRGVNAASWADMSVAQHNSIKTQYEADVHASQREYDLGGEFRNINLNTDEHDPD